MLGSIIAVLVTLILDAVIGNVMNNIPSVALAFTYTVLLSPIVIVWYILTELGSIIENAGKMGAPVPGFLQKAIAIFN
jgi:phage-related holin